MAMGATTPWRQYGGLVTTALTHVSLENSRFASGLAVQHPLRAIGWRLEIFHFWLLGNAVFSADSGVKLA